MSVEEPAQVKPPRVLVNLGCGGITPAGWINTDKSWHLILQCFLHGKTSRSSIRYLDLSGHWPFASGSVDVIYLSHVLEHLGTTTRGKVLQESSRVLKPGGVLRIVVPDLYQLCRNYIAAFDRGDGCAAGQFLYWLNLHRENVYPQSRPVFKKIYDYLQGYPKLHRTMYDRLTLSEALFGEQWSQPRFFRFGESKEIPEIADVEGGEEICASLYAEVVRIPPTDVG